MPPRYVLIANPGTKRCELYRSELIAFWEARGGAVDLEIVPWADVIPRVGNLDHLPAFDHDAIVRMESPGKDNHVTRLLLEAGARNDPAEPHRDWRALELPKGLLVRPGLLYGGFRRVLVGLRNAFDARPHLKPTACPLAIAEMFDKTATAVKLHNLGVPVPEMMSQPIDMAAVVHDLTLFYDWPTAYIKLNTGSSATGIVVLHPNAPERPAFGVTTLAELDGSFYNSRLVRRVSGDGLQQAAQFVLDEGAIIQRGIPMAQIDGQNFDVRVVCIHGKPSAIIFRLSPNPMTNLHLGGQRGDFARCRATIPTREWLDALDHCSDAAACFDSAIAGVDLLFERGFRRHYILEVNAFGDFFPGWTNDSGQSVHSLEIEATMQRLQG
ncbi:MAG: STM4014 family protein [Planctomycetes bacterium]|nr:STM4014 family protein [Planctomycetota bacterium]